MHGLLSLLVSLGSRSISFVKTDRDTGAEERQLVHIVSVGNNHVVGWLSHCRLLCEGPIQSVFACVGVVENRQSVDPLSRVRVTVMSDSQPECTCPFPSPVFHIFHDLQMRLQA